MHIKIHKNQDVLEHYMYLANMILNRSSEPWSDLVLESIELVVDASIPVYIEESWVCLCVWEKEWASERASKQARERERVHYLQTKAAAEKLMLYVV